MAAEFAFTNQPGHPRRHVLLLLSLALAAAVASPEPVPPVEAPPAETSSTETAATAPSTETAATAPSETPRSTEAPGGYWNLAEQHERSREPPDGEDELTIGSVLFSLGFLRAGAGVLAAVMGTDPDLCPLTQAQGCIGLRNYGWAGVAEGGLMIGTGITYLAIGLSRRQRHHRWERGDALSWRGAAVVDVGPWLIPRFGSGVSPARVGGAGLRLQLQF